LYNVFSRNMGPQEIDFSNHSSNLDDRSKKLTDGDNKELIDGLKRIEKQLSDIKYDLADIKREMPKVPFYGDLLQDIVNSIENIRR
jgi:hypothetical protein